MPFMPGRPISISTRSGDGLLAELHGVGAVLGLAHHAEFGAALQDRPDAIAHQFVIIDKNNVERHSYLSAASGVAARTVVPVSRVLVIDSSSPACAA